MLLKKYKVLLCDNCLKPQMTSADDALKCLSCGHTSKFFNEKDGHLRHLLYTTDYPQDAEWAVSKASEVMEMMKEPGKFGILIAFFDKLKRDF